MRSRMFWVGALLLILVAGFVLGSQKMTVAQECSEKNSNNASRIGNWGGSENNGSSGAGFQDLNASENAGISGNTGTNVSANEARPKLFYFYRKGCSACAEVTPWLENEMKNYASSIELVEHDIDESGGWGIQMKFCSAYGVPANETFVPMVFIGNAYLWGVDGIRSGLGNAIEACLDGGCETPPGMQE